MPRRHPFPPIRACLFDMDGLLLNTEDMYTACHNQILARYGAGPMTWTIKQKLMGRPAPESNRLLLTWAGLEHLDVEEYMAQLTAAQEAMFPTCAPLPGVEELLETLRGVRNVEGRVVHVALATSSRASSYALKTRGHGEMMRIFDKARVLGDDARIWRGKPRGDIYLLALKVVNEGLGEGEEDIRPEECLVFEDGLPGVEAGRRAGMRVVWVPHPGLAVLCVGKEQEVLAGRGENSMVDVHELGEIDDGWGEQLVSLKDFSYQRYGIQVPALAS